MRMKRSRYGLSHRELEVFALSCSHPHREVGRLLGISEQTVKNHIQSVYRRLKVNSKTQAAQQLGWLIIPPDVNVPKSNRRHADGGRRCCNCRIHVDGVCRHHGRLS